MTLTQSLVFCPSGTSTLKKHPRLFCELRDEKNDPCYEAQENEGQKQDVSRYPLKCVCCGVSVARGGKVVAELVEDAKGSRIAEFIKKFVKTDDSELYTDQYKGNHNEIGKQMKHETMNRSQKWEPDEIHTNTMEGFWSFVKRAWYRSHHHYSTAYTPLYLAEACYKYNYRHENIFAKFLTESMNGEI